ncbi:unnamed protein product [Acanthoscelides obtectus]|uniref:Uncharacterized protein n=1 Tax=Acanthoscelides obtectus TaxID=200917 RepID=A0A9P0PIY5_ACAOB|nr:unnamed protein product [Acanthoscelides obtectus]CAK1677882.1 hypothetical protein AOBTE_LOCUS31614 [Acanthoscelides obtectus]
MSQHQQLIFQREVLEIIEKIKYGQPSSRHHHSADLPNVASFYTNFSERFLHDPPTQQLSASVTQGSADDGLEDRQQSLDNLQTQTYSVL